MDAQVARWRLHSQGLSSPRARTAADVVQRLLCVQAENPSQSALAVATRTTTPDARDLAARLASGEVLCTHVLRPTWHHVLRTDLDWLLALTGPRVRRLVERQLVRDIGFSARRGLGGRCCDRGAVGHPEPHPHAGRFRRARGVPMLAERLTGQALMLLMAYLELDRAVCSERPADG